MPVVSAGQTARLVHSLLDDGPFAVSGENESVEINLEAVGDRVVVDARRQTARANERLAVEASPLRDCAQFSRACSRECLPRPPQM